MSSKEEITELVGRIQDGELLMPELWVKVERLVAWQANRIISKVPVSAGVTFEDLYNSGYIALDNAVRHYERDTGEFIALFMLCLKGSFAEASGARSKKAMQDPIRQPNTASLDAPLDGTEDLTLCDTISDKRNDYEGVDDRIYNEQLHNELERALNAIDPTEATVLRNRYYGDRTIKETGDTLNMSQELARQIEGHAFRSIRNPRISKPLRQFVDEHTNYYQRAGVTRFQSTGFSSVEEIAMYREKLQTEYEKLMQEYA